MANSFNFTRANNNTPWENGWCERYAEQGFGLSGVYPSAYAAYEALPATNKHAGTPPNDGNYYILYFDGWYEGQHYGDVAVYRNGQVWSGSNVKWRAQANPTTFSAYKSWIGTAYLCWSEFLGSIRIATQNKENSMIQDTKLDYDILNQTYTNMTGQGLSRTGFNQQIGRKWQDVMVTFYSSNEAAKWYKYAQEGKAGNAQYIEVNKKLYEKK